jgi:hypothetical protein
LRIHHHQLYSIICLRLHRLAFDRLLSRALPQPWAQEARGRYGRLVRWDDLFAELEGQLSGLLALERDAEVAERTRAEMARVAFSERLRGSIGRRIRCTLAGSGTVAGDLVRVGADFALVTEARTEAVVTLASIAVLDELPQAAQPARSPRPRGVVGARLGLASVLRSLAHDRSLVTISVSSGLQVTGTPAVIGADFVEVAMHRPDEAPRRQPERGSRLVPFSSIQVIRRPLEPSW